MTKQVKISLFCIVVSALFFSCKKDAQCVCTYTEANYSTNVTTRDTFVKTIHERRSAHKKACESPNFAGTNAERSYNYETKCWLQ